MRTIRYRRILLSTAAALSAMCCVQAVPTEVLFCFDTEDYTSDYPNDAIRDIARMLTEEGVTGQFFVVGYLAQRLQHFGRKDVIDALKPHVIGSQTLYHSRHPALCEYTDVLDAGRAYRAALREEAECIGMLKAVFDLDHIDSLCPPGNSISYAGMVSSPGSYSVADVFQGVVRFLRGEKSFLPDRAYGFLAPPKGIGMPMRVFAHDLREAAEKIDFSGYLPSEIDVGSVKIGPADFLFAVLEVLDSGAEEVVVVPRPQLGSFDGIAKLETLKVAGTDKWIIHSPDFKDDYLSDRLRLQLWTLRYE